MDSGKRPSLCASAFRTTRTVAVFFASACVFPAYGLGRAFLNERYYFIGQPKFGGKSKGFSQEVHNSVAHGRIFLSESPYAWIVCAGSCSAFVALRRAAARVSPWLRRRDCRFAFRRGRRRRKRRSCCRETEEAMGGAVRVNDARFARRGGRSSSARDYLAVLRRVESWLCTHRRGGGRLLILPQTQKTAPGRGRSSGRGLSCACGMRRQERFSYMPSSLGRKSVMSGKSTMTTRASAEAASMGSTGGVISSMVRLLILAPTYRLTATGGVT